MQARPARSRLRLPIVGLCLALTTGLIGIPASQAAPRQDLQQVEAQVRDLQMRAAAAHEEAERARARLEGIRSDLSSIENRREREPGGVVPFHARLFYGREHRSVAPLR